MENKKIINGLELEWSDLLGEFVYYPRPGIALQWDDPTNDAEIKAQESRRLMLNLATLAGVAFGVIAAVNGWVLTGTLFVVVFALARVVMVNIYDIDDAKRTESMAWRRQVKGVYIYSLSPDDRGVRERFEYAIKQLKLNGNQYSSPVSMFMYRDVCFFQAFIGQNGAVQHNRVHRQEDMTAVESWEAYMVALQRFINSDRQARLMNIRGNQSRDPWVDLHYFQQSSGPSQKFTVRC